MRVFLSYAAGDDELARRIAQGLQREGFEVWWDEIILPGDNWADEVAHALKNSQAMVVLLTPAGLQSKWVQREIEFALVNESFRRRLIPVLVGDERHISLEAIPWILRRLPMVRLSGASEVEAKVSEIARALSAEADSGVAGARVEK